MHCSHRIRTMNAKFGGVPVTVHECALHGHCTDSIPPIKLPFPAGVCGGRSTMEMVSAVCLAYDLPRRLDVLEEAIESFLRQTYPIKELVIVNDTPGMTMECDAPGVRVINVPPCEFLGQKYNSGVEEAKGSLICSWDDDDISLPWRMSLSVEQLGTHDYFNPKAYWILYDDKWKHEYKTGYGHNASIFRKTAWEKVGKYEALPNGQQDAAMDRALIYNTDYVIGNGNIEESAYLYRFSTGLHHGCHGPNPDPAKDGHFVLNPHWNENYVKMIVDKRPMGVPCWLTNRDAMQVREMVNQLLLCEGIGPITIVDCESTYQPLTDWYDNECPVHVIRAANLGNRAPWNFVNIGSPYIVSDADLDMGKVPRDVLKHLEYALEKYPNAIKAGVSLRIDDLPDGAPLKGKVIDWESKFWTKPLDAVHYDADIDTTFALYRKGEGHGGYGPAVRLAPPYVARHVPWYLTPSTTTEDWRHYFANAKPAGLMWGPQLASALSASASSPTLKKLPAAPFPLNDGPKLTIGIPMFRDYQGLSQTIMGIVINHPEVLDEIEIIVIDNDKDGDPKNGDSHSGKAKGLCGYKGRRYEHFPEISGTAAAKGRVFELATAPAVLVIDCHVTLPNGVLRTLIDWMADHPDSPDLYQGPLLHDGGLGNIGGTHFKPAWGSCMYGQWEVDPRFYEGKPFEILMQGCGLFACNKSAWPGFHPLLRGFGPEEFHLHQRIRARGGKCYCLPWLQWWHRFGNPDGAKPPGATVENRLRGHLITHLDTGAPTLASIRQHFVDDRTEGAPAMSRMDFDRVVKLTRREFKEYRPSMLTRAMNFTAAMSKWALAGMPVRNQDQVDELLVICKSCPEYRDQMCTKCGCPSGKKPVLDKLVLATEKCPLGKW